ncbi:hypothetical protein SAMN05216283_101619 [Sunxiuqinia elliptica]|uniref:Uncharacterized protein n=1 Tax=Sunxiuqinia elliptica TaxID=655355 RepID=A0A1I2C6I8_9BACT|nr:hypothetical protein SAMN05216283_101619 [Sunxiuqinia elliptica]
MGAADSDPPKVASELGMTLPVVSSRIGIRDTRERTQADAPDFFCKLRYESFNHGKERVL